MDIIDPPAPTPQESPTFSLVDAFRLLGEIAKDPGLSAPAVRVLVEMIQRADNRTGRFFASWRNLAKQVHCGNGAVTEAMASGYVTRVGKSREFRVNTNRQTPDPRLRLSAALPHRERGKCYRPGSAALPMRERRAPDAIDKLTQLTHPSTHPGNSRATWITPFWDAWKSQYGGKPKGGQLARDLDPLVKEHGAEETLRRFKHYLSQTPGQFASSSRFASTFGEWIPGKAKTNGLHQSQTNASKVRVLGNELSQFDLPPPQNCAEPVKAAPA